MASNYLRFTASVPCTTSAEQAWARELMEVLERIDYGDWSDDDQAYVEEHLGLVQVDQDDLYGVPDWDIADSVFTLYSSEARNGVLTSLIFQAYIKLYCEDYIVVLSYAEACDTVFSGGAFLITADDVEIFDPTQLANNARLAILKDREKASTPTGLVAFGSHSGNDEPVSKTWWVSMCGTVAKQWTFPAPVTKVGALRHVEKKQPKAKGDIRVTLYNPTQVN